MRNKIILNIRKKILLALCFVGICGGAWYVLFAYKERTVDMVMDDWKNRLDGGDFFDTQPKSVGTMFELSQQYTNDFFGFMFRYPSTYIVSSLSFADDGIGDTIVVQNNQKSGFQVVISLFDEDITELTEARIRQDIFDMRMEEVAPMFLGNSAGITFVSDNEAFDGASREVWFVYKGYLYQISTYVKDEPLLRSVLDTWRFL